MSLSPDVIDLADRAEDRPANPPPFRRSRNVAFWLLVALIAVVGVEKAARTPLDPDLFWHLNVARQLLHEGIHPIVDHISFASRAEPWTPYSWLAELGMKAVWDALGYRGTILLQAVANIGIIFFMALSCAELTGASRAMNSFVAIALAACLTYPYLSFRPVTFAIFWLAIVAWLLLRDRRLGERSAAVWFIIPITALLANIHLVVLMVPIWASCLLAAALWEWHGHPENRPERRRRARRYGVLLLGAMLACLGTPMLPGAARSAWNYQFNDVMVASGFISEMRPIYSGLRGMITVAIVAALLLWAFRRRNSIRLGEWLWLIAGAALMLRLGRFAPMFAIIAAPLLAATLPPLSDAVLRSRFIRILLTCAVVIGMLKVALDFPPPSQSLNAFLANSDTAAYPTAAAQFVLENINPRHHRLINEFTWGGYLGWRLGDRFQILLDGRTQLFSADFWRAVYLDGEKPRIKLLAAANADVAILPARKSEFEKPLRALGWRMVYSDAHAHVLVPPDASPPAAH